MYLRTFPTYCYVYTHKRIVKMQYKSSEQRSDSAATLRVLFEFIWP